MDHGGSAFQYACLLVHKYIFTRAFVLSAVTKFSTGYQSN